LPNDESKNSTKSKKLSSGTVEKRAFFCNICYEAFVDKAQLDEHMKTHRELEVSASSCRMDAKPAGVF
jgi:hypothetical protein